jgi:hypothetical protein
MVQWKFALLLLVFWNGHFSHAKERLLAETHRIVLSHHQQVSSKDGVDTRLLQNTPSEAPSPTSPPPDNAAITSTESPSTGDSSLQATSVVPTGTVPPEVLVNWEYENVVALRWHIQNPPQVTYSGLQFEILFTVSDFIEAQSHVRYELYESEVCGKSEKDLIPDNASYITTEVIEDSTTVGGGFNSRVMTVSSKLDPQTIRESKAYVEQDDSNAAITFCVRFSLWSGPPSDPAATSVNHVDATVSLTVDLTDEFSIEGQTLEAKDQEVKTTDDEFFVDAFLCHEDGERIKDLLPFVQGEPLRICVQPTPQALEVGFRMRGIDKFTFEQGYTTQEAIINQEEAANGLTEIWCEPGVVQCMFESLLFAFFFQSDTSSVYGYGLATLQWGATEEPSFRSLHSDDEFLGHRVLRGTEKVITIPEFGVQRADHPFFRRESSSSRILSPSIFSFVLTMTSAILCTIGLAQ